MGKLMNEIWWSPNPMSKIKGSQTKGLHPATGPHSCLVLIPSWHISIHHGIPTITNHDTTPWHVSLICFNSSLLICIRGPKPRTKPWPIHDPGKLEKHVLEKVWIYRIQDFAHLHILPLMVNEWLGSFEPQIQWLKFPPQLTNAQRLHVSF